LLYLVFLKSGGFGVFAGITHVVPILYAPLIRPCRIISFIRLGVIPHFSEASPVVIIFKQSPRFLFQKHDNYYSTLTE